MNCEKFPIPVAFYFLIKIFATNKIDIDYFVVDKRIGVNTFKNDRRHTSPLIFIPKFYHNFEKKNYNGREESIDLFSNQFVHKFWWHSLVSTF